MRGRQPRLSQEEHARLGTAIYEQQVRPQVEAGNPGKIVAIDVETGAFEVAEDALTASQRLLTRYPHAKIWCIRIGYRGSALRLASYNHAGYEPLRREQVGDAWREPKPPSGYRTQSADTSPGAEQVLIEAYRRMPPLEKVRRLTEIIRACEQLALAGIRERHPQASEWEIRLRLAALRLDRETVVRVFGWDPAREGY